MKYNATAMILAGGGSTRMGQDKASLPVGEDTLLGEKLPWLLAHFNEVLISAQDKDHYSDKGLTVVPDEVADQGPLMGLYSSMAVAQEEWIFLIACDQVNPPWDLVETLWAGHTQQDAIAPKTERGIEPLFAFYKTSTRPVLRQCLDKGMRSLHQFLKQVNTRYVDAGGDAFWNINTPEAYKAYLEHRKTHGVVQP